jgi:hypothetical protein
MPVFRPEDLTDAKSVTFKASDLEDATLASGAQDMRRTSTQSPAELARSRFASGQLTRRSPEAVKMLPLQPTESEGPFGDYGYDTNLKSHGSLASSFGQALNPFSWLAPPIGEMLTPTNPVGMSHPTNTNEAKLGHPDYNPTMLNLPSRVAQTLVPDFSGTAKESYRRGEAGESTKDMYGAPLAAGALAALPKMGRGILPKDIAGETAQRATRNLLGTKPEHFSHGATPDTAVLQDLEGGLVTRSEGRLLSKLRASKAAELDALEKDVNVPGHQTNLANPMESVAPVLEDAASRAVPTEATKIQEFNSLLGNKVRSLSNGSMQLNPAQMVQLKRWLDGFIGVYREDPTGTLKDLAQNTYSAVRQRLDQMAPEVTARSQRIQSLIKAEDAYHNKIYGGEAEPPHTMIGEAKNAIGSVFPTTLAKTSAAALFKSLSGDMFDRGPLPTAIAPPPDFGAGLEDPKPTPPNFMGFRPGEGAPIEDVGQHLDTPSRIPVKKNTRIKLPTHAGFEPGEGTPLPEPWNREIAGSGVRDRVVPKPKTIVDYLASKGLGKAKQLGPRSSSSVLPSSSSPSAPFEAPRAIQLPGEISAIRPPGVETVNPSGMEVPTKPSLPPDIPDPALRPKNAAATPRPAQAPVETPAQEHARLIEKRDQIIKDTVAKEETPNRVLKDEAARRNAKTPTPPKPTHIKEGASVSGQDDKGGVVSGMLDKLYPTVDTSGKPTWRGVVLDSRNSRNVDLPADSLYASETGPPKTVWSTTKGEKTPEKYAKPSSDTTPTSERAETPPLDKGAAAKRLMAAYAAKIAREGEPIPKPRKAAKPPGSNPAGMSDAPKAPKFSKGKLVKDGVTGKIGQVTESRYDPEMDTWWHKAAGPAGDFERPEHNLTPEVGGSPANMMDNSPASIIARSKPLDSGAISSHPLMVHDYPPMSGFGDTQGSMNINPSFYLNYLREIIKRDLFDVPKNKIKSK